MSICPKCSVEGSVFKSGEGQYGPWTLYKCSNGCKIESEDVAKYKSKPEYIGKDFTYFPPKKGKKATQVNPNRSQPESLKQAYNISQMADNIDFLVDTVKTIAQTVDGLRTKVDAIELRLNDPLESQM